MASSPNLTKIPLVKVTSVSTGEADSSQTRCEIHKEEQRYITELLKPTVAINSQFCKPSILSNRISHHSQNGVTKNGADDSDMIVDEYCSNGCNNSQDDEFYDIHENEVNCDENQQQQQQQQRTSTNVSVITSSKVVDPGPSMRQLCGGNIFSIEKLIAFGKTLQNIYKDMTNELGSNPENENLMKEAFSLLAYNNPQDSPVGYLLDPIQREGICSSLNSVILEAHKLPGQPALERIIGQSKSCLKLMGKNGLGASAMVKVEDFYVDR